MIPLSYGATTGARTVAKEMPLRAVSGTCCPTDCAVDLRRRGLGVTASVDTGFGGKVSWSRSGVILRDPIPRHEPRGEMMAR